MRIPILLLFQVFALVAGPQGFAAESSAATVWFKPFFFSPPGSNLVKVSLFGRIAPQASVTIDPNLIVTANPSFDSSTLIKAGILSTVSDATGHFQLAIELPLGLVQIPIAVATSEKDKSTFLVSVQVAANAVELSLPQTNDDAEIRKWRQQLKDFIEAKYGLGKSMNAKLRGVWVQFGLGYNYQTHSQTLATGTTMSFESLSFPSPGLIVNYASEKWLFNLGYRQTPGEAAGASAPFTLRQKSFVWSSTLAEAGLVSGQKTYREKLRLAYLLGLQQHFIPQFEPTFGNEVLLRTIQITSVSIGPDITAQLSERLLGNLFLRYQVPITSASLDGGDFDISPQFAFDGSLGLIYRLKGKSHLGLFWFGQWYKYKFSSLGGVSQAYRPGEQGLFYSSAELRYIIQL